MLLLCTTTCIAAHACAHACMHADRHTGHTYGLHSWLLAQQGSWGEGRADPERALSHVGGMGWLAWEKERLHRINRACCCPLFLTFSPLHPLY
jgi:hypothetical protein